MKRLLLLLSLLLAAAHDAAAQEPLYLVNGREVEEIGSIPPDDIESVEMLPADDETAARVVLRYTVNTDGRAEVSAELESTDSRLRRRVLKAVEEAPLWEPATKNGAPVASEGVLRIQLPEGKPLPRLPELIWR